jgi:tetratricopeptide (TPR) repeat protein
MNRQAAAALDSARPAIARLDRSRHAEELAADLIEAWAGIETALRSLLGGTPLAGQNLIREARQRQLITFDQANALAEFHAARERAQDTSYHPSDADINAAREGFLKLEAALMTPAADDVPRPIQSMTDQGLRNSPLGAPQPVAPPREGQPWWFLAVAVLLVAALGVGGWYVYQRNSAGSGLERGVQYYQNGQRELAVGEFTRAARDNPSDALPYVYLSRMAREAGNTPLALQNAEQAVRVDPGNATAQREMGAVLLAAGNYEMARRFYVRALQLSPEDRSSQGFLGCALLKLGRYDEGMKWMNRAGTGAWSGCAMSVPPPGMMPPTGPRTTTGVPR